MLENTDRAIKMDIPEKPTTLVTQDTRRSHVKLNHYTICGGHNYTQGKNKYRNQHMGPLNWR